MTPNYATPIPQAYQANTALPAYYPQNMPVQYPGYRMPQKSPVTNGSPSISAVKIDINGATIDANGSGGAGAAATMPMYPGRAQLMPPSYMPPPPQMQMPLQQQFVMPPYMPPQQMQMPPQPQVIMPPYIPPAPQQQVIWQVDQSVQPLFQAIKVITPQPGEQPSIDEQVAAIQTIAQYAKTAQEANDKLKADPTNQEALQAKEQINMSLNPLLINENTFKGLASIAVSDTSGLSGTEKQQADETRVISMWTLSMLQKLFREEMDKESQNANIPPMSIDKIPGMNQIITNISTDPNPEIKEAGIIALMEVADLNNKQDVKIVKTILETAEKDNAENVKTVAEKALESIK
ncbi:MAG: hypothetical protein KAQ92_08200 [Candidatus Aenigmarchaeota archaeon]|nr:hypothetical protein [Candidatus Aenigmarchaeota archaeon]